MPRVKCPVSGCNRKCRGYDTLFVHLTRDHEKNEIIKALLEIMAFQHIEKGFPYSAPKGKADCHG